MTTENHSLSEIPTVVWVLATLAGISGAMLEAHRVGVTGWELVRRIGLRLGGGTMVGIGIMLIFIASGAGLIMACGFGILTGVAGADVVLALFLRWAERRVEQV